VSDETKIVGISEWLQRVQDGKHSINASSSINGPSFK